MRTRKSNAGFKDEMLPQACAAEREAHPDSHIEVWTSDEHRMGLIPILRKVWAPRGQRPQACIRIVYEWLWVVAFVHPATGRTSWWLLPVLNTEAFVLLLQAFAKEQALSHDKRILLVLDGAGWHVGAKAHTPPGLQLVFQPPKSPEVQPAEHLWELVDEPVVNRTFERLNDLERVGAARCCELVEQTEVIKSTTCFHWWPDDP